jgi:hypothetical protein
MTKEEIYGAEQEFKRFEIIMNTQAYLTQEEYGFCLSWDKDIRNDILNVGGHSMSPVKYLNLRFKPHPIYKNPKVKTNDLPF